MPRTGSQEGQASMAYSRAADSWRLSETLIQPFRLTAAAMAALVARLRPGRDDIRMPPLSREWLRQHEIDSLKHRDLP